MKPEWGVRLAGRSVVSSIEIAGEETWVGVRLNQRSIGGGTENEGVRGDETSMKACTDLFQYLHAILTRRGYK